jgi:predicted transcriptional regulator
VRTTIELKDEHRAALLELAARRKQKGFSGVIEEAVEAYLKNEREREVKRRRALAAIGSFTNKEAEHLRKRVHEIHERWR